MLPGKEIRRVTFVGEEDFNDPLFLLKTDSRLEVLNRTKEIIEPRSQCDMDGEKSHNNVNRDPCDL